MAVGAHDDDTVLSLGNRLVRLTKQLDDKALAKINKPATASAYKTSRAAWVCRR